MGRLSAFWNDERGATAVEYGAMLLVASLIAVTLASIGNGFNVKFQTVATKLQ